MLFKSKLVSILRTISSKELKYFEEYILSPFFNKNEKVIALFSVIKKFHPEFPEDKVGLEQIFVKVFPKEKIDEQKLRYVMTDLTKLLEDFLAYIEFDKSDIYKKH